jgi:hypothetical protein
MDETMQIVVNFDLYLIKWKPNKQQTLNNNKEFNVALALMHLQYDAQHEKKIRFCFIVLTQWLML